MADAPIVGPNGVVGILGGGQLGRMLAVSAAGLGLKAIIYSPERDCPAGDVAHDVFVGGFEDAAPLESFRRRVDVVTYEFENVPARTVEILAELGADVAPGARALAVAQDRLVEKQFVRALGAYTAPFHAVDDIADLAEGLKQVGAPAILKTRRLGYDGKGQTTIRAHSDNLAETWEAAKRKAWEEIAAQPSILEGFIDFACEISVIAARGRNGAVAIYDPARNEHRGGILRVSTVPSGAPPEAINEAKKIATRMLAELDYVGVIGVEFFVTKAGGVIVNEFAPRVHNSGHWTMDGCAISQFEQHIRAVCGWPLGATERHSDAVMENLIGEDAARWLDIAADGGARLHLYGKGEMRSGRKMGHVNRLSVRTKTSA